MSKGLFNEKQIQELKLNKYVKNVSDKSITYTDEFKLHFIAEYEKGIPISIIFEEAGFDIDTLGYRRINSASARWRKAFKNKGVSGLQDTRRSNSGRTRTSEMTSDEIIAKQKAEIEYLKAEVEMLKKLELAERNVIDIATKTIKILVMKHRNSLDSNAFIHSDQGVHYTHPKFQNLLREFNLGQSMSRKGNCWDNAPMESFFGHMKDEVDFNTCHTFSELDSMINEYMHYYNNKRYQWNLKKLTPVMYRNQLLAA